MSIAEIDTLRTNCEVKRTQVLKVLSRSVKNPQNAGFILTRNCSLFILLYYSLYISLYIWERVYYENFVNYLDTVMYVDILPK